MADFNSRRILLKKIPVSMLVALAAFLTACGSNNASYVKKGDIQKTLDQQAEKGHYFETIGIGAADPSLTNNTQRLATSRDAAIVQAQYEMLSLLKGVQVEGGHTVEKAVETDSKIETYLKDMIHSAEVVKTEWTKDDGCVVTLHLDKKKLESVPGLNYKS
jgi:hypothetical protein